MLWVEFDPEWFVPGVRLDWQRLDKIEVGESGFDFLRGSHCSGWVFCKVYDSGWILCECYETYRWLYRKYYFYSPRWHQHGLSNLGTGYITHIVIIGNDFQFAPDSENTLRSFGNLLTQTPIYQANKIQSK